MSDSFSGPAAVSRFRKNYRRLSAEEQALVDLIKDEAAALENSLLSAPHSREVSLALTKLEEAVMWAVKGITS